MVLSSWCFSFVTNLMWNASAGKGFTLQKLTQFRILSAATAPAKFPQLTQNTTNHSTPTNNSTQILTQRAIAGRSSSSATPPRFSDSINTIGTNTSLHCTTGSTEGHTFESGRSEDSQSYASTWESNISRSEHPSMTESHSDELSTDFGSGSSTHPHRLSRWDSFQAHRNSNSSTKSDAAIIGGATETISVEHRRDPSLFTYEKEFVELQRDKTPYKEWNKRFPEGTIVVYTDGSCIDNRASGFGIYFGPNHELNRSERIIGPIHNSGLAEILGAQTALRSLRNWRGYKNEPVILRTDFLPLVRAMNGSVSDGRFGHEMEEVRDLARSFPQGVQFEHVYAHDGDPGNEQADALARIATADARRARSASVARWNTMPDGNRRGRSLSRNPPRFRSRSRSRNRSRSISWNRNRSRSRNNNRDHIRSHSAFVAGRRR